MQVIKLLLNLHKEERVGQQKKNFTKETPNKQKPEK